MPFTRQHFKVAILDPIDKAIDECIEKGYNKYRAERKTLMTLKFQSCENVQFLAVKGINPNTVFL